MSKIFQNWLPGNVQYDLHVQSYDYANEIHLTFVMKGADGKLYFAKPLKIEFSEEPHKPGLMEEATLILSSDNAIRIHGEMRDIFEHKGLRTKDESRLEGVLEATDKHLQDMRTLVFKKDELKKEVDAG